MTKGIGEADLDFLLQQYDLSMYLRVPKLYLEINAYLLPNARDRDKHLADSQQLIVNSVASLLGNFIVFLDEETNIGKETKGNIISMNVDSVMIQAFAFMKPLRRDEASSSGL